MKANLIKGGLAIGALISLPAGALVGYNIGYNNPEIPQKPAFDHISAGEPVYSRYEHIDVGCPTPGGGFVTITKMVFYSQDQMERISMEIDERIANGSYRRRSAIVGGIVGLSTLYSAALCLALYIINIKEKSRGESG